MAAPFRVTQCEVHALRENMEKMLDIDQGDDISVPEYTNHSPTSLFHKYSITPSSSKFTPPTTVVISLAIIMKVEATMDTLLHHIHP